jgi:cation transport ATPase
VIFENKNKQRIEIFAALGLCGVADVDRLKKILLTNKGVIAVNVNPFIEKAYVNFNTSETKIENIIDTAQSHGYHFELLNENTETAVKQYREFEYNSLKRNLLLCLILAFPLFTTMFLGWFNINSPLVDFLTKPVIQLIFVTPIMLLLGTKSIVMALKNTYSIYTLASLGSFSAYFLSVYYGFLEKDTRFLYFDVSVIILIVVHFTRFLDVFAKLKVMKEPCVINKCLTNIVTKIRYDGEEELFSVDNIEKDNILIVKCGEQIAVDGIIISGETLVDESIFTGACIPIPKKVGDVVYAGTINIVNSITISVCAIGEDTKFSKTVNKAKCAKIDKDNIDSINEKLSKVFIVTGLTIVIVIAIVNIVYQKNPIDIFTTGMSVLLTLCPCSLWLAKVAAINSAKAICARYGIFFKVDEAMEILKRINFLILEKNDVITSGELSVVDVKSLDPDCSIEKLYDILYSVSSNSSHSIAKIITQYCKSKGAKTLDCVGVELSFGGVKCKIGAEVYSIGNYDYSLNQNGKLDIVAGLCNQCELDGEILNIVLKDGKVIAVISLVEIIRETVFAAADELRKADVSIRVMTQGGYNSAVRISNLLGISSDKIIVEHSREEKCESIESIIEQDKKIAMVGSGLNNAIILSKAHVGISMCGKTNALADISDVIIKNDDLLNVYRAIEVSRGTVRIINQNIILSCVFNIVEVPFVLLGILSPAIVSLAMIISFVCIIANSLRIRYKKIRFLFAENK